MTLQTSAEKIFYAQSFVNKYLHIFIKVFIFPVDSSYA